MTKEQIIEAIKKVNVSELNKLVKACGEEFGVGAVTPTAVVGGTAAGAVTEEGLRSDVVLTNASANKIGIIRAARKLTGLGLKGVKEIADGAPKTLKGAVAKEEVEDTRTKLAEVGAEIELK